MSQNTDLQKQIDELNKKIDSPETSPKEKEEAGKLVNTLMDVLSKRLALEAQKLEIQEREYHIKDLRAKIADREIAEKQIFEDRESQGRTIAQQKAADAHRFANCTHKKGGMASPRDMKVLSYGGNAAVYAVMKHQMINGDIWVRCLRCGKTWAPPVQSNFFFDDKGRQVAPQDGVYSAERFARAVEDYKRATMFETNNSMSTSVQCRFTYFDPESGKTVDAAEKYRENIASTTLR